MKVISNKCKAIDSNIVLSIGMIVKNEEKVLDRCLKSLQPLMKEIPSELIIADTGSTDSSVEIAKKYTDNVFHFEWINDFAAARNSTLEKAKGQWYMFIDADEYLDEDISEMVNFFKISELRSKYKTLEIMVRSYTDPEHSNYRDACLARFHRIDDPADSVHFVGIVHEGIWIRQPLGYFSTILHHTGYCYSSEQQKIDKKNRNMVLMREEYKNNPEDLRILCHLIDGSSYEVEEKEKYIINSLELVRKNRKNLYANVSYMQMISYYKDRKPDFALELCDEYCSTLEDNEKYVATVAIYLYKFKILSAFARYEQAYDAFNKYVELYKKYKDDKLDLTDASAHPIEGITEEEHIRYNYIAALNLKKIQKYEEAFDLIKKFEIDKLDGNLFKEYLGTVRDLCKDVKRYDVMAMYYDKVMKCESHDKRCLALYMMESAFYSIASESERMNFARDVAASGVTGTYIELMKLCVSQDDDDFSSKLLSLCDSIDNWDDGYSELIYLAVKHGIDISKYVIKMKSEFFREKIETVSTHHDDFAGYVLNYDKQEQYHQSIKQFFWLTSLYEKASYRCFMLNDEDKYNLYQLFVNYLGDYVMNIYNPDLLSDDDIDVLPALHKFGYYMSKANKSRLDGDDIGYIRNLKVALLNCESMKEIVSFLLDYFRKEKNI